MSDHYATLGVDKTASAADIKKAYRKLAHKYHPDKENGNEEKFKEVNSAYQVIGDEKKRSQYDQYGQTFEGGQAGHQGPFGQGMNVNFEDVDFGNIGDIFGQFFGGKSRGGQRTPRGEDVGIDINLTFSESARKNIKEVSHRIHQACETCHGNGAEPGTPIETCQTCQGQGAVSQSQQTPFGAFAQQVVCPNCKGDGKLAKHPCKTCSGQGRELKDRTLDKEIPAGISDGQTIRLSGKGAAPAGGGVPGDMFVTVHVAADPNMTREADDVHSKVSIPYTDAALGTTADIQTLEGTMELKIPAGTQPKTKLKLTGKGFANVQTSRPGDHIITVDVSIPTKLTKEQDTLLRQLKGSKKRGFFG